MFGMLPASNLDDQTALSCCKPPNTRGDHYERNLYADGNGTNEKTRPSGE
jgi:hypothetical protein